MVGFSGNSTGPSRGVDNYDRILHIIADGESKFNAGAHGDKDVGGSHGAFQFHDPKDDPAASTRQQAIKMTGLDPAKGNIQEQAVATLAFIQKDSPDIYQKIGTASTRADWNPILEKLGKRWYSLPGSDSDAWKGRAGEVEKYLTGSFQSKFDVGGDGSNLGIAQATGNSSAGSSTPFPNFSQPNISSSGSESFNQPSSSKKA